ncbi:MAG TPA: ABC transporter ATP-binding protein [Acidimicrobiales bacterium]|nr:ABC transporter ATP-binding protein [Acidimicrobiales bacterium]
MRNLTKRFGTKVAVDDLSFDVPSGRVTGFLGPNGAGKTTTLRTIVGLLHPDSGSATIDGTSYRHLPAPMRQVGALLEAKSYHPARKARDHLAALALAGRIPLKRVDEVLDLVGLSDVGGQRAGTFSLGMSQRLGIATALLGDPPVLIFDEPVNGLDPEGILWVRTFMQSLAAQGRTVFVSSHLMSEMALMATHAVVIGRGRLIADSSIDDILKGRSRDAVRVRTPRPDLLMPRLEAAGGSLAPAEDDGSVVVSGLPAERIGDIAMEAGSPLYQLVTVQASLEEAFMELTREDQEYHGHALASEALPAPAVPR